MYKGRTDIAIVAFGVISFAAIMLFASAAFLPFRSLLGVQVLVKLVSTLAYLILFLTYLFRTRTLCAAFGLAFLPVALLFSLSFYGSVYADEFSVALFRELGAPLCDDTHCVTFPIPKGANACLSPQTPLQHCDLAKRNWIEIGMYCSAALTLAPAAVVKQPTNDWLAKREDEEGAVRVEAWLFDGTLQISKICSPLNM